MQIAFHIGANCTDEDRLLKSALKNAEMLLQRGIAVPGPSKYRRLLRETLQALDGVSPRPGTRDILIDAIVEDDDVKRVVLSNDNFIAIPKRIFDHGQFYPQADSKLRNLRKVFAEDEISLYLGIRNPASFLQETLRRSECKSLGEYLGFLAPDQLRWSDVIARIRHAAPQARLTVWCNEDTPLIWEDILRSFCGVDDAVPLAGAHDLLDGLLTEAGLRRVLAQLADTAPEDRVARQEMIADALESHARPEIMEDQIELPELDAETVADLTDAYEDDLEVIADMPGVDLILPFDD